MFGKIRSYKRDEDGAVTVDWVVLTGAIAFIAIGVIFQIRTATTELGVAISEEIDSQLFD